MKKSHATRVGHLPTRRKWNTYVASALLWLTGLVWVLLHYFAKTTDEFDFTQPHPAEHYTLIAHAAVGFWALWLFGVLWPGHVKASWRAHARRNSGGWLFGLTVWLTLTGYLLYYLGDEAWVQGTSLAHWIPGLAALVPFIIHLLTWKTRKAEHTDASS